MPNQQNNQSNRPQQGGARDDQRQKPSTSTDRSSQSQHGPSDKRESGNVNRSGNRMKE